MKVVDIKVALQKAGILPGDLLMVHGDAAVAAQLVEVKSENRLAALFNEIINYLGEEGTLIVPTFSYSFTRKEVFDVCNTKSSVGAFSEYFRCLSGVVRSLHPIFSIAAYGKKKNIFKDCNINDCFGKNTCFDLLYKLDAKLMNLGCNFNVTFAHYVEQELKVKYRYFKSFEGFIKVNSKIFFSKTKYFVGNKKIHYTLNLDGLKKVLLEEKKIRIVAFDRLASYTVSCKDFFHNAELIIKDNEYGLIEENKFE